MFWFVIKKKQLGRSSPPSSVSSLSGTGCLERAGTGSTALSWCRHSAAVPPLSSCRLLSPWPGSKPAVISCDSTWLESENDVERGSQLLSTWKTHPSMTFWARVACSRHSPHRYLGPLSSIFLLMILFSHHISGTPVPENILEHSSPAVPVSLLLPRQAHGARHSCKEKLADDYILSKNISGQNKEILNNQVWSSIWEFDVTIDQQHER